MARTAWSVGILVAVALVAPLGAPSSDASSTVRAASATATPRHTVDYLLYGDSLSAAAAPYLAASGTVGARYQPATAPCDWLPALARDAAAFAPREVLVQFVGNALSPCMVGRDPPPAYRKDVQTLIRFWQARHVPVVVVLSPLSRIAAQYSWAAKTETAVARRLGAPVRDAGQAVRNDGAFTFFLPCWTPTEPTCGNERRGMVRVRLASDGLHFAINTPTYSAGAFRFGAAMADCWLRPEPRVHTVRAASHWLACDPVPAGSLDLP